MAEGQGGASSAQPPARRAAKGPDPLVGRVINDRFRIVSRIARGGMGKVYRAEQAPLGREVALKVLNPNYSGENDPEFHKRFFLEASTCSKLTHPNTVTIFDYGRTDDDVYYIAMELLEGRTLHRELRQAGALSPERAMHVARQICRSLREAHSLGVIHRDLKPANIFLMEHGDETDFVKVLDFGLVKDLDETGEDLTQTGLFMGSPKYMSPEQIRGERVDARADVYALGVILYEMLTAKVPFDRPNSVNILMAHVHEAPPPIGEANPDADVPPVLEQIVMKALAKAPDDRFTGMDQMLVALKEAAANRGLSVTHSNELALSGEIAAVGTTGRFPAGDPYPVDVAPVEPSFDSVAPAAMSAAPGPRSRAPLAMAIIGGLALVGAGIVAVLAGTDPEEEEPPDPAPVAGQTHTETSAETGTPETEHPDTAETETPGPVDPEVQATVVALRSEPPGATVTVEDREYGPTPTEVEWTGDEAERGRRVTLRFSLDGHRDYSVTRVITGDHLEVEAELEAIQRAPRRPRPTRPRPRRPSGGDDDESVGAVQGYKLDPY